MDIRLITNTENKWGLSKDVAIIGELLEKAGHRISVQHWSAAPSYPRPVDINIHIELVGGRHFRKARRNILVPNPEWFMGEWLNRAKARFDLVFCKTKHSTEVFRNLGFGDRAYYAGFTSVDRLTPGWGRVWGFVHVAGNSMLKNTHELIRVWLKHPEWPELHVFASNGGLNFKKEIQGAKNIIQTFGHVPEGKIIDAQNMYTFAIQPSASEGFGHCILEPMSAETITITSDAPPMNEFVPAVLTPVAAVGKHWYDTIYKPIALETTIEKVLDLSVDDIGSQSSASRQWWLENKVNFERRFLQGIKQL